MTFSNTNNSPDANFEKRRRNGIALSAGIGVLLLVIAIGSILFLNKDDITSYLSIIFSAAFSLLGFTSAWLCYKSRIDIGIYILIAGLIVISLAFPVFADGQGILQGISLLLIIISIAITTLPAQQITNGIMAGLSGGFAVILADVYLPSFTIPVNQVYIYLFTGVILVIFLTVAAREFSTFPLRVKLLLGFLIATIVPLAIFGYINYSTTRQILLAEADAQLTELSNNIASNIDNYINNQIIIIHSESKQIPLIEYIERSTVSRAGSPEEVNASLTLSNNKRKDAVFIHSYAILDKKGRNILDTVSENQGRDESANDYFKQPFTNNKPYVSNIIFQNGKASIFFSAPIKNRSGEIIGILREEIDAKVIQTLVRPAVQDGTIQVSVIDRETYLRVAFTGDRERLFKSYNNFSDLELQIFQAKNRLPAGSKDTMVAGADPAVVQAINVIDLQPRFEAYSISLNDTAINVGTPIKILPWVAIARESENAHLAPIETQTRNSIFVSLLLIGGSIIISLLATTVVAAPIVSLSLVAKEISAGNFSAKAIVQTQDEIGALAQAINQVTDEINRTLENLEKRVEDRTLDLENSRAQSEKRSRELQAVGEISNIITSEQRTENLLPLITRLVSERFNFYHVGIFLLNDTKQFAQLMAANSPGGQRMLARGHRLEVGATGIVGNVTSSGKPRIALDVGSDSAYFNNPDLSETHSEMALPLIVRGVLIGALDIQSTKSNAFDESDIKVLSILADQIATAIENARLFESAQNALNEVQAVYGQFIKEQWVLFAQQEELTGYHQGLSSGTKLTKTLVTDEINQVMNQGKLITIKSTDANTSQSKIVAPIKLRGQVIGIIQISTPPTTDREWNQDEITLTEVVSERMALALESARLLDESQARAAKEQLIGEVTSRIGSSINMQNVLQTAVEELGRALPGSEVVIQMQNQDIKE